MPLALLGARRLGLSAPARRPARRARAVPRRCSGSPPGSRPCYYTREVGPSGDDFTGLLAIPAGLLLLGLGAVTLWRTRRTDGGHRVALSAPRAARRRRRCSSPRWSSSRSALGVRHHAHGARRRARRTTSASRRGRHVHDQRRARARGLVRPVAQRRRRDRVPRPQGPAAAGAMLARHGYGVLLFDRRGEGDSDGEPNACGWGGDADIKAAIAYLQTPPGRRAGPHRRHRPLRRRRDDARGRRRDRRARRRRLRGRRRARRAPRTWTRSARRREVTLGSTVSARQDRRRSRVFANQPPPANLKDLVGRDRAAPAAADRGPEQRDGERAQPRLLRAPPGEPKTLWEIPESGHVGGHRRRGPQEYERRVVGFFDQALLDPAGPASAEAGSNLPRGWHPSTSTC